MWQKSNYKNLQVGDLVYYKVNQKSESVVDKTRSGIIVEIPPGRVRSGFTFVMVMWSDTQEIEEVAVNYLYPL
tara:strand:- start:10217 stop:10435 length:219 start_codon:yes stop_codon:yes gene_type:complete